MLNPIPAKRKRVRSGIDRGGPLRSEKHLRYIRSLCCACCGSDERTVPAHIRIGTDGSLQVKPSDAWTLPLTIDHHDLQHKAERSFWTKLGIDPHKMAIELARRSPDPLVRKFAKTMVSKW